MRAIHAENVSIRYITGDFKDIGLKEFVMRKLTGNYHVQEFWADRDVSFTLEQGDMLGIIGTNGAGKSTLLKAISGIMVPTTGHIECHGKIAALLELASGFDGDLTVRENTFLRGALLGYTREFMEQKYDEIIRFAELEDFQEHSFKQLSSGMKSRLAFSIACLVDPDILILDEVLSVGDGAFRDKSAKKMREILNRGVTGLLVSHSLEQVRQLCNKVLWLDHGRQVAFGDCREICDAYAVFLDTPRERQRVPESMEEIREISKHFRVAMQLDALEKERIAAARKEKKPCPLEDRRKKEDARQRRDRLMQEAAELEPEVFEQYYRQIIGPAPAPQPAKPQPAPRQESPRVNAARPPKPKRTRPEGSRELWIDLLKIVACYAVILIHSTGWLYQYKFANDTLFKWVGTLFQQSLPRFAVPCFMMLSGAFALSAKQYDRKTVLRRVLAVGIPGLVWSLVYILLNNDTAEAIRTAVYSLPFYHAEGALWYVYFIIQLYLLSPVLSAGWKALSEQHKQLFILLTLLVPAVFDSLLRLTGLDSRLLGGGSVLTVGWQRLQLAELGMVALGKYLYDQFVVNRRKVRPLLPFVGCLLSGGFMMLMAYTITMRTGTPDFSAFDHLRLPSVLYGVSVLLLFASMKPAIDAMPVRLAKLVEKMGGLTLEVYLSHVLVMRFCERFHLRTTDLIYHGGAGLRSTFLDAVIYFVLSFMLAFVIDFCIRFWRKAVSSQ